MLSDKEGPHMGYTEPVMVEGLAAHPGGRDYYKKKQAPSIMTGETVQQQGTF